MAAPSAITFEQAMCLGSADLDRAREALQSLPRRNAADQAPPKTLAEALSIVSAREEERKRKESKRDSKSKARGGPASPTTQFPGSVPGQEREQSAYWMVMEDYFRDITRDDVEFLLPRYANNPLEDPALLVPPLGRAFDTEDNTDAPGTSLAGPELGRKARRARPSSVADDSPEEGAASGSPRAAAEPGGGACSCLMDRFSDQELLQLVQTALDLEVCATDDAPAEVGDLRQRIAGEAGGAGGSTAAAAAVVASGPSNGPAAMGRPARRVVQGWLKGGSDRVLARLQASDGAATDLASVPPPPQQQQPSEAAGPAAAAVLREGGGDAAGRGGGAANGDDAEGQPGEGQDEQEQEQQEGAGGDGDDMGELTAPGPQQQNYLHPHTQLLLSMHVPPHVLDVVPPHVPAEDRGLAPPQPPPQLLPHVPSTPTFAALTTGSQTPSSERTPQGAVAGGSPEITPNGAETPGSAAVGGAVAAAAAGGAPPPYRPSNLGPGRESGTGGGARASGGAGGGALGATSAAPGTAGGSGFLPRGRSGGVNYSLLAGRKQGGSGGGPGRPSLKSQPAPPLLLEPLPLHPAATAVAALVAAGEPEGGGESAWAQLRDASGLVGVAAPDDEVLAELLACQGELMAQRALTTALVAPLLPQLLEDLPRQAEAARQRQQMADDMRSIILRAREAKRLAKREKRQEAQAAAVQAIMLQASADPSPRSAMRSRMRARGDEAGGQAAEPGESSQAAGPEDESDSDSGGSGSGMTLLDRLASHGEEKDAECGVCGDGSSYPDNPILFCERCDIAVHQRCYHVTAVPDGDWLCWPCREYEEQQRVHGVAQDIIRPPRWQTAHGAGHQALDGGSRSVTCALCPVRHGTFRKSADGKHWVHQACAQWNPELTVDARDAANVVHGLHKVLPEGQADTGDQGPGKPQRKDSTCTLCGRSDGATVKCNFGHCMTQFHVTCARNSEQYLAIREPAGLGRSAPQYRSYCLLHSMQQRAKDEAQRAERAAAAARNAVSGPSSSKGGDGKVSGGLQKKKGGAGGGAIGGQRRAQLQALAKKEAELELLGNVRLELESLRLLMERISKREKLRGQLARLRKTKHLRMLEVAAGPAAATAAPALPAPAAETVLPQAAATMSGSGPASQPTAAAASPVASSERTRKGAAAAAGPAGRSSKKDTAAAAAAASVAAAPAQQQSEGGSAPTKARGPRPGKRARAAEEEDEGETTQQQQQGGPRKVARGSSAADGGGKRGAKNTAGDGDATADVAATKSVRGSGSKDAKASQPNTGDKPPRKPDARRRKSGTDAAGVSSPGSPRGRRGASAATAAAGNDAPPSSGRGTRHHKQQQQGEEVEAAAPPAPARRGASGRGLRVKLGGGAAASSSAAAAAAAAAQVQVDRECMMTSGEAKATNTRLPRGYLYVPADVLKAQQQGQGGGGGSGTRGRGGAGG